MDLIKIVSSTTNSGSNTTPIVNMPSGAQSGDLLIILISKNGDVDTTDNNGSTPTVEDADVNGFPGGNGIARYSRILTSSEPSSFTFTLPSSQRWDAIAFIVRNWDGTTKFDLNPNTGQGTATSKGGTTNYAGSLVVACAALDGPPANNGTFSNPASPAGWRDIAISNSQQPLAAIYKIVSLKGVVDDVTLNNAGTAGKGSLDMFAIKSKTINSPFPLHLN
jgi:hypothetical protein